MTISPEERAALRETAARWVYATIVTEDITRLLDDLEAAEQQVAKLRTALKTAREMLAQSYDGKDRGCACPYGEVSSDDHCRGCVQIMTALREETNG